MKRLRIVLFSIVYLNILMNPLFSQNINLENKIIPESIKEEVLTALEYFPELYDTAIEFKFKDRIKKSTMQAQPKVSSIFKSNKNREYVIFISREIHIDKEDLSFSDIPKLVKIGWFGHELGHIMDYQDRTNFGLIIFGIKYLFSKKSVREAERTADTYAIIHGMGEYIIQTKNFILDNADISEKYKARIRRLYISPEEVMEIINKKSEKEQEKELEEIEEEIEK